MWDWKPSSNNSVHPGMYSANIEPILNVVYDRGLSPFESKRIGVSCHRRKAELEHSNNDMHEEK